MLLDVTQSLSNVHQDNNTIFTFMHFIDSSVGNS